MADDPQTAEWKALLCGRHRLEAINASVRHPRFGSDDADEAMAIQMDGRVFLFVESRNDGSSLGLILHGLGYLGGSHIWRDVDVSHVTARETYSGECSLFEFRDIETGKVALTVGTADIDDYYPSFVWNYDPTAFEASQ